MENYCEDLIYLSSKLEKFVVGFEGNVSKKVDYGILIKSSGKKLSNIQKEDFTYVKNNGEWVGSKPSMEYKFHQWIMDVFKVNYVSHTHPTNTLKILCSNHYKSFATERLFPDQVIFNGKESCIIDYFNPGDELFEGIKKGVNEFITNTNTLPKLILLKNHGIITFGNKVDECIMSTEICEKSAEIFIGSQPNPIFLTEREVVKLLKDKNELYRLNKI